MTAPEDAHDMETQEAAVAVEGAVANRQGVSTRRSAPMLSEDEAEVCLFSMHVVWCLLAVIFCSLAFPVASQLYYVHHIEEQTSQHQTAYGNKVVLALNGCDRLCLKHDIELNPWVPMNPKAVMANSLHAYREAVMMKVHLQHSEEQPAYIPSLHAVEAAA